VIRIPVIEGENQRADRNRKIGALEIQAHVVKRNVPAGSDVEVTIEIDESRLVRVKAYIPVLDEEYEVIIGLRYPKTDPMELRKGLDREKERLNVLRKHAEETQDPTAQGVLSRIDRERMILEVEGSLAAASADQDAGQKARNRLGDLRIALDQAEDAVAWPALVADAQKLIMTSKDLIRDHGEIGDARSLENHEAEVEKAIQTKDPDILRRRMEELRGFVFRVLDKKGIMQVIHFQNLSTMKDEMRDKPLAEQLISQGQRAMNGNDIDGLRATNRQLAALLPSPPPPPDISTVH
jgi:molecular chaperone DnaK